MQLKFLLSVILITQVLTFEFQRPINEAFLETVMRKYKNDETVRVLGMFDGAAAKPGENYATHVHRIKVTFTINPGLQEEDTSLIVKIPTADEGGNGLFNTEITIMSTVLPKMNESLNNDVLNTPVLLDFQNEAPAYIVMEDLKPLGYQGKDRQEGLGWKHSQLAIDGIARFHAASVSVLEKESKHITKWWRGIIDTLDKNYVSHQTKTLAGLMQKWGGVSQQYAKKVLDISDTLYDRAFAASKPKPNNFNVLIHGDYTSRNMLFRYNDCSENPSDQMIIDFQFCQFTSPAVDLWFMFATSVLDDVSRNQVEELVVKYHRKLETTMREIGAEKKVMTLQQLQDDMRNHAILYFFYTAFTLPWNLIEADKIKPISELFSDIQANPEIFYNAKFRRIFERRLVHFNEIGVLDL